MAPFESGYLLASITWNGAVGQSEEKKQWSKRLQMYVIMVVIDWIDA